jgi:hypothetical protein
MSLLGYFVAAVFLPLFPFSMAFNRLFAHLGAAWPRIGLLLLWPQLGLLALQAIGERPPAWLVWWALLTALLYALRSAALRDLGLWTGYLATSAWALLWAAAAFAPAGSNGPAPALQAAGLSLPLMLLSWLVGRLETTFGAA